MWDGAIPQNNSGKYIFQFREISEDVLKMGKQYENGLGPDHMVNKTDLGDVPASVLIYAFDANANNRSNQDVEIGWIG
jgi:cell surface protein SprA